MWFHEEPLASVYLFTKGSLYWEKVLPTLLKLKVPKASFRSDVNHFGFLKEPFGEESCVKNIEIIKNIFWD